MTSMAASTVPKFYKSVIDDVVNNIREIFLDDGVDEQVIQDLRTIWERKITDTRAIEHATNNNSNTNSNTSNSKSKSNSQANKQAAAAAAANQQSLSAAGAQTSVITSNPNHMKNGPSSNSNNNNSNSVVRVKDEIIEEEQQHHSQQQHQTTARRPVAVTTQPQLTTMVQPASPMVTTNGNLIHHPNLAQQVAPSTNILRASAIVSNPSGPASLPAGLNASNSGHLIQVLQQPNSALRHQTQNYSTQAQPQAAAQPSAPSTSGQISSNRQSAIYTIIPSPSSSFSPVIVSSSGGQTAATSSSTFTTNHYKSGGGNSVGTFTPKIVVPKVTGGGSGQVPHTTAEHLTNMNNVQQNRIVSIAPHGHKKRILNSINTDRNNGLNGSVVSGASFGGGNLASLADVAVSHTNQNTHLLNSMNLARQQQATQRLHLGNLNATAPAGANLATTAGHRGLITHAALQPMAASNNNNHQQQHIILGPGSAGSGVPGKQEPMKFQTIIGPGGQKVMILPNNAGGQYVMAAPSTQFVLTPEILNQINLSGGILTTGPNGQPTVLHRAPASLGASTIQYATAPGIQQVRTVAAPGLMQQLAAQPQLGQPGSANATNTRVAQLDGLGDSSSEDEDEDDYRDNDDDQDDNDDEMNDEENDGGIEDEEPLNSGDDVSEEDPNELFDTDNVVVCQYDKITRSRNKWKFHFKDGIMNLQGKDYVFQKAVGDAEW